MIDVKQRALRAFKQQMVAGALRFVEQPRHVSHHRLDALGKSQRFIQRLLERHRIDTEIILQHEVVEIQHFAQLGGETLAMEQVLQPDRATCDLVFVRRADTAASGANLACAFGGFARAINGDVIRQDQRTGLTDFQPRGDIHPRCGQRGDFIEQRFRRQHHAVADIAGDLVAQDARRDQVQHGLFAVDHQRVPGVMSALKPHHALRTIGQPVDDLALAFVTPLGADYYDVLAHFMRPSSNCHTRYGVKHYLKTTI